jgi:hypothetical protein
MVAADGLALVVLEDRPMLVAMSLFGHDLGQSRLGVLDRPAHNRTYALPHTSYTYALLSAAFPVAGAETDAPLEAKVQKAWHGSDSDLAATGHVPVQFSDRGVPTAPRACRPELAVFKTLRAAVHARQECHQHHNSAVVLTNK